MTSDRKWSRAAAPRAASDGAVGFRTRVAGVVAAAGSNVRGGRERESGRKRKSDRKWKSDRYVSRAVNAVGPKLTSERN